MTGISDLFCCCSACQAPLPPDAPNLLGPCATDGHPCSVEQLRLEVSAGVALERAHHIQVHDMRAMHADEPARIETGLEAGEREMKEVSRAPRVGDDVVAIGLEPRHALDREGNERAANPDEQPADWPAG